MYAESDAGPAVLDLLSSLQKSPLRCGYGAPYVAVATAEKATIAQGCCNHWDCPKCRYTLAAYHKHRMIEGANILLKTGPLYFWTTTCRGKDLDIETADDDYYTWTNRLLATCRARAKKQGMRWEYVQVTERQKRGAAHSHFIHTFCPDDGKPGKNDKGKARIFSAWFKLSNVRAGLGPQCEISEVENATGVGAYISGYLEKQISQDVWPRKWKRIRYSRGWPDAARVPDFAIALTNRAAWERADEAGRTFEAADEIIYGVARKHMFRVVPPSLQMPN